MQSKQVILAKTEYDAMEEELNDLRTIVASRQVVTIVEENMNWRLTWASSNGTRIKYIVHEDQVAMKTLAEQVNYLVEKLQYAEDDVHTRDRELGRRQDEINRLNKQTWYQKLFGKK